MALPDPRELLLDELCSWILAIVDAGRRQDAMTGVRSSLRRDMESGSRLPGARVGSESRCREGWHDGGTTIGEG